MSFPLSAIGSVVGFLVPSVRKLLLSRLPPEERSGVVEQVRSMVRAEVTLINNRVKTLQEGPWRSALDYYQDVLSKLENNSNSDDPPTEEDIDWLKDRLSKAEEKAIEAMRSGVKLEKQAGGFPLLEAFSIREFCFMLDQMTRADPNNLCKSVRLIVKTWHDDIHSKYIYSNPQVQQCLRNNLGNNFLQSKLGFKQKEEAYEKIISLLSGMLEGVKSFASICRHDQETIQIIRDFINEIDRPKQLEKEKYNGFLAEEVNDLLSNNAIEYEPGELPGTSAPVGQKTLGGSTWLELLGCPRDTLVQIAGHMKMCYLKNFSKFKPLPFYKSLFDIGTVFVNLELENESAGSECENYREAITKALSDSPLVLLKGDPGMGKTMTQKRLAYDWANGELPEYDLVLCARFRDVQSDWETIWDLIMDWMKRQGYLLENHIQWLASKQEDMSAEPRKDVSQQIHVLCFIDGLDEAKAGCKELESLLKNDQMPHLSNAVIVTSRPFAIENINCPFPTLTFQQLDDQQVVDCTLLYLEASGLSVEDAKTEGRKLLLQIYEYDILHLARIPLLLSCLCFIRNDILRSDSVVHIYLKICQALIDRHEELRGTIKFNHKSFGRICAECPAISNLSKMCLAALVGAEGFKPVALTFTDEDLERFEVDRNLWLNVGLLNADREEGVGGTTLYELPHATFLEVLAAAALYEKLALGEYELPIWPELCTIQSRLETFTDWPKEKKQHPIDMALAGFYFAGKMRLGEEEHSDCIKCFYCNNALVALQHTNCPLWMHAVAFPSCDYLLQIKGQEFIDFVARNKSSKKMTKKMLAQSKVNVTDHKQVDQMHLPQSEKCFKELWEAVKPWSLEQMWIFLFEMAAESNEDTTRAINNTVSLFLTWCSQLSVTLNDNNRWLEIMLKIFPKTNEPLKNALRESLLRLVNAGHTPSSLLQAAWTTEFPMYKINEHAVYMGELDVLLLVESMSFDAISSASKNKVENLDSVLVCQVEQEAINFLKKTCMQIGWTRIENLTVYITSDEKIRDQDLKQVQPHRVKIRWLKFHFDMENQATISLSPLLDKVPSLDVEKLSLYSARPIVINDLPILFSNPALKDHIEYIDLGQIHFPNTDAMAMFGEGIKNFQKLDSFILLSSNIRFDDLLNVVESLLDHCPISTMAIIQVCCLENTPDCSRFIEMLTQFKKLKELRLSWNRLSTSSIDKLCKSLKQIDSLEVIALEDPNVTDEHLQSLKNDGFLVKG